MVGPREFSEKLSSQEAMDVGDNPSEQVVVDEGEEDRGKSKEDMVYVCGDSHTLTSAWREVAVGAR